MLNKLRVIKYNNVLPFLRLLNCWARMQAKVGPTSPPYTGRSAIAPGNKSISSTSLESKYACNILFDTDANRT
jgi:hypothetical protein